MNTQTKPLPKFQTRIADAVRPIGNRRRTFILSGAFAWLFISGVIGGAGVISAFYAPQSVSIMLAALWLGVTLAGAALIGGMSARMTADEPESVLERVYQAVKAAHPHGIAPEDIAARLGLNREDLDRLIAILFDDGKVETCGTDADRRVLYRLVK